jgi:hypothetical protein
MPRGRPKGVKDIKPRLRRGTKLAPIRVLPYRQKRVGTRRTQVSAYIDPDTAEVIKARATARGCSVAIVVGELIAKGLRDD